MQEADLGAYWASAADPREPSPTQCGACVPPADEKLVRVVEELKTEANGHCADLRIVAIPDDVKWGITKTVDGGEPISEAHRIWE